MKTMIGDIIEIPLKNGFAYAQCSHIHSEPPKYGPLIQVFNGVFSEKIGDPTKLYMEGVRFILFFPLDEAVRQGLVKVICNAPVPSTLQKFPTFRIAGLPDRATKRVRRWGIWDGSSKITTNNLTDKQRELPILGVWNHTILVERINSSWRPEMDPR